jgi:outer membrane protein assembly factor BamB
MLGALMVSLAVTPLRAQWAQFGGPNRDFTSPSTGLATEWADDGPKQLWSRELGDAYSGIAADTGTLYTMYRSGNTEIVVALDADNGETRWEHRYAARPFAGLDGGFGIAPRSTPLVLGDRVITLGINAHMFCLERATGKVLWQHDLIKEYKATRPRWGYSSSALAYKNTIIVPVGGKGHSIMAFDHDSGAVVWSAHDFANAYSSPMLIDVDGQEQLVVLMAPGVVGLDPAGGDLLWSYPHVTNYDVNASQPVWGDDNLLFISSDYETGSRALRLTRSGDRTDMEEVWAQPKMKIHFGSAIRIGDLIYGSSGNRPAVFAAVNVRNGKMAFRRRGLVGKAQLLSADEKLIILDEDGQLAIATPKARGLKIHAKVQLLESISWTAPTLVGKRLYVRDRKKIMALDLG